MRELLEQWENDEVARILNDLILLGEARYDGYYFTGVVGWARKQYDQLRESGEYGTMPTLLPRQSP